MHESLWTFLLWQQFCSRYFPSSVWRFPRQSDLVLQNLNTLCIIKVFYLLTDAAYISLKNINIYIKTYIKIVPTCFGLRPSSGSLHMSLAKVTFIKSVKVRRYGLWGCVAACYIKKKPCVFFIPPDDGNVTFQALMAVIIKTFCLLACDTVQSGRYTSMFRRSLFPSSSGYKNILMVNIMFIYMAAGALSGKYSNSYTLRIIRRKFQGFEDRFCVHHQGLYITKKRRANYRRLR